MMIFSVRRPQYFSAHTKSQRLFVTLHRLSCEKVNLHNTLVMWAWNTCGLTYLKDTKLIDRVYRHDNEILRGSTFTFAL